MATDHARARRIPRRGPLPLLPPPRRVDPGEVRAILEEHPTDFGVALWRAVRAVDSWSQAAPGDRARIFADGAPERWRTALPRTARLGPCTLQLEDLLRELSDPDAADPDVVAGLCMRLSDCFERAGSLRTAIAFAEGAALAMPRAARPALVSGRLLKRAGAYARAETWLQQALSLAVGAGDWTATAQAWSEVGTVFGLRGNLRAAESSHLRAFRTARRWHLQQHVGVALHDLFLTAVQSQDPARAQRYARQATDAYYPGHPRLAAFANDLAYFWMLNGEFSCALQVFLATLPRIQDPRDRYFVCANIVRAAGSAGRRDVFDAYWRDTLEGLRGCEVAAAQAWALLDLAHGGASLGEWEAAEQAAVEAVRQAERYGETRTLLEAESVLDSIRRHKHRPRENADRGGPFPDCQSVADALENCLLRTTPA